jgi:hypothetical protein
MRNEMRKMQIERDKPTNRRSEEENNEGKCTVNSENEGIK